jgi:hypothetical protein
MQEDHAPEQEAVSPLAPRRRPRYIIPAVILVALALCAVLAYRQLGPIFSPCNYQPDSVRNPPLPPGAEQVGAGAYNAQITFTQSGGVHKELHFDTASAPQDVYAFYNTSLSRDQWSNGEAYPGYTYLPGLLQFTPSAVSGTFYWGCGLESKGVWAINWFRAWILDSGKTHVILNYEYID